MRAGWTTSGYFSSLFWSIEHDGWKNVLDGPFEGPARLWSAPAHTGVRGHRQGGQWLTAPLAPWRRRQRRECFVLELSAPRSTQVHIARLPLFPRQVPAQETHREVRQRQHGVLAANIVAVQLDSPVDVRVGARLDERWRPIEFRSSPEVPPVGKLSRHAAGPPLVYRAGPARAYPHRLRRDGRAGVSGVGGGADVCGVR